MSKTLYVSDLDGTLLNSDTRISETSRRMLNQAIAEGALFTVATARTPATVGPMLQGVDMKLPAIVMTGGSLWDTATGHYSDTSFMAPGVPERLLEIYRRHDTPTFLYTLADHCIQMYHIGPLSDMEAEFLEERSHTPYKKVNINADGYSDIPANLDNVLLLYAIQPNDLVFPVFEETSRVPDINALCYHDRYGDEICHLEAFPKQTTKANALRRLARKIGADRIVAFGDNLNDLPMLGVADLAVAVENAVEEVKAKADIIIGRNDSDAVARFIIDDFRRNSGSQQ